MTHGISALGQLVLFLHRLARGEPRLKERDPRAKSILWPLKARKYNPKWHSDEHKLTGLELRNGAVTSETARRIRQAALKRSRNYEVFLRCVEHMGYTPQLARAAFYIHYHTPLHEELGSLGHCVLMDIQSALSRCDPRTRKVLTLLIHGAGPQAIGETLGTNGSRQVGDALRQLSRLLEGKNAETKTTRRRPKGDTSDQSDVSRMRPAA